MCDISAINSPLSSLIGLMDFPQIFNEADLTQKRRRPYPKNEENQKIKTT